MRLVRVCVRVCVQTCTCIDVYMYNLNACTFIHALSVCVCFSPCLGVPAQFIFCSTSLMTYTEILSSPQALFFFESWDPEERHGMDKGQTVFLYPSGHSLLSSQLTVWQHAWVTRMGEEAPVHPAWPVKSMLQITNWKPVTSGAS